MPKIDDVICLLDAVPVGTPIGLRDRATLETLFGGGLRVSELVGLNLSDLEPEQELVRVRGKGRRERLSPIGHMAMQCIDAYLPFRECKQSGKLALSLNRYGTRLTTRSVWQLLGLCRPRRVIGRQPAYPTA
jgi:integrase/recombinase XerC